MSTLDDKLINLIKSLPDNEKQEILDFAEYLNEKRLKEEVIKNITDSQEILTDEDLAAIEEARNDVESGNIFSIDEIERNYGLN